jgi:DNA-binding transcriptional MocR family regulator
VALELLDQLDATAARRRDEMRGKLDRMEALLAGFEGWTWRRPPGGLCLWVRLPHGSALAFTQVARAHGVGIAPGTITSASDRFDDHIRLPFGDDPERTKEGMHRLAAAWHAFSHRRE